MKKTSSFSDFKQHIINSFSISENEFERLLDEFLSFYHLEVDEFVQYRHYELKKEGLGNNEIYERIQNEIRQYRFVSADLSIRQIRRIIYG